MGEQWHSNYKMTFSKQEKPPLGDRRPVSDPSPFFGLCSVSEVTSLASPRASLPDAVINVSSFCLRVLLQGISSCQVVPGGQGASHR